MSAGQYRGRAVPDAAGVAALLPVPSPPWRYLWLYLASNGSLQAPCPVSYTGPPGPDPAQAELTVGVARMVDSGYTAARQVYVAGLDPAAVLWWAVDTEPIADTLDQTQLPVTGSVGITGTADVAVTGTASVAVQGTVDVLAQGTTEITGPVVIQAGQGGSALELTSPGPGAPGWAPVGLSTLQPDGTLSAFTLQSPTGTGGVVDWLLVVTNPDPSASVVVSVAGWDSATVPPAGSEAQRCGRYTLFVPGWAAVNYPNSVDLAWSGTPSGNAQASALVYARYTLQADLSVAASQWIAGLSAGGTDVVAAPASGYILFLGADLTQQPASATVPTFGAWVMLGSASGVACCAAGFNWNTNAGLMAEHLSLRPPRPVALALTEGIKFEYSADTGAEVRIDGVIYYAVGL